MSSMPPIRRTIKNVVRNYSEAQVKVREATSNDPWGPSSTLMSEIADLTYNVVAFTEIMQMIWKRLNDHGKNWRHVYKALVLLDYIIKTGSEKVAQQCKENIYAIQTLKDFQYKEDNRDQGMNVREKAKQLVQLLKDDERLRNERAKALKAKERFAQNAMGIGSDNKIRYGAGSPSLQSSSGGYADPYGGATGAVSEGDTASPSPSDGQRRLSADFEYARPSSVGEEEIQLQLALAMSKEEHDEQERKIKSDDIKLQMAMEESRKHADDEPEPVASPPRSQPSTDPWGMPQAAPAPPPTDPWGAPLPAPPGTSPRTQPPPVVAADPWGSPVKTQPVVNNTDPWGAPVAPSPLSHDQPPPYPVPDSGVSTDPWGATGGSSVPPPVTSQTSTWGSPPPTQPATNFDSNFSGGSSNITNGNTHNVMDDFDLLGSRSTGSSPAKSNKELAGFDPLREQSSDVFNLGDMDQSLSQAEQQQQKHRKTPQEFLGDNAALVNLDQLVTKKTSTETNPFAPKGTNPFNQLQQQQQAATRRTLNELQTYNTGFTQSTSVGLLPNPMAPLNGAPQPAQQNNPFL